MSRCQLELKAAGAAYPRTCPTCGLSGACAKGLDRDAPPMTDNTPQGLEARGMRPDAAEILAKEMQAIVAADRWKGRDLHSAPPEKWHKLRPETQQFWIDTATRILAALEVTP